jgi:hypothetical protein
MRILIILTQDQYVRNYIQTGAFDALRRGHECLILLADPTRQLDEMRDVPGFIGVVRVDKETERAHYDLFNTLTWYHRSRSRTFRYRFSRLYRSYPYTTPRNVLRNLRGLIKAARYVLLGNHVVGRVTIPRMIDRLPINADLVRALGEVQPDLVVMPSSASDPIGNDLVRLSQKSSFRSLFLVDNWDNLSSKSVFWATPDFLGVWGDQSRDHAAEIHGIAREQVFLLGTPRFESYYQVRTMATPGPFPFPYVLFCGSALPFDELGALHRLDDEVDRYPDVYRDLKIVYRPHPYRQPRLSPDTFRESDFRHTVIDRQVADAYHRRDNTFQPPLAYYPALLASARLVVGPLTTMLVESLLCATPVLGITYDDGIHYTSPHNAYRFYMHFEGIEGIRGLRLVSDADRLGDELRQLIVAPPTLVPDEIDASLQYFLYKDDMSYGERLAQAVSRIAMWPGAA